jgi:4-diphosphocytidyl-2-C-methyl-D-erythritol kinase
MKLTVRCPAKINTFLSVGAPDQRGWHPLRTIFQAVSLSDELEIEPAERDEFSTDVSWMPQDNSVIRALEKIRQILPVPPVKVHLTKRIPAEAGLGGGSSNAAGMLRAAAALARWETNNDDLARIALELGADVPFFLTGGRAKAEGYGERLDPLPDRATAFLVIAKPEVGCPTAEMYRRLDEWARLWREFPAEDEIYNDFEQVAPAESRRAIALLKSFSALDAGLTGSGSATFGFFPDHTEALTAAELMRAEGFSQVWVASTLSREESLTLRG